jgi:hypothetical protein
VALNTDREKAWGLGKGAQIEGPSNGRKLEIHKGWPKAGVPDGNAWSWIIRWFEGYKPPRGKGFELVIVNATYYGKILETGTQGGGSGRKYKVVTYMLSELVQRLKKEGLNIAAAGIL